jgi:hypothetical protein
MKRYSFTLEVAGISTEDDRYEDVLFEAGCDDALISVVDGKLWVDFDREAASYDEAVRSGAADIERAGGKVVKALPLPPLLE